MSAPHTVDPGDPRGRGPGQGEVGPIRHLMQSITNAPPPANAGAVGGTAHDGLSTHLPPRTVLTHSQVRKAPLDVRREHETE
jgi:hypothetical protein